MTEAYIFDLDGTLLNTLASLANSFNRALSSLGYPIHPEDSYRYIIGDGLRKAIERCLPPDAQSEADIDRLTEVQQADYDETWRDDAAPYEGIPELIAQLGKDGHRLAVFSNKNHAFTVRCVEHFFPDTRFDIVLGHQAGLALKPDPAGALYIAEKFELAPGQIAFIGDTATDMNTAVASGMLPIGALWGFRDRAELKKAGARHIIAHPSDVIAVTRTNTEGEVS